MSNSYLSRQERRRVPALEAGAPGVVMGRVSLDGTQCTGCNLCVVACPAAALELDDKKARMVEGDFVPCIACGDCVAICEPGAIVIEETLQLSGFFRFLHRGERSLPRSF